MLPYAGALPARSRRSGDPSGVGGWGREFLLSPNRLNVAVSRAQALAIVVGSPELVEVRRKSVEEMRLVNLLCHLVQYAEEVR